MLPVTGGSLDDQTMKYFVILIIILFVITYNLASDNSNSLSTAEKVVSDETSDERYQKIDLSRITIRGFGENQQNQGALNSAQTQIEGSSTGIQPEPLGETTEVEETESTREMQESRFSKEGEEKYRPENDDDSSKLTIEMMKKKFNLNKKK